MKNKLVYILLVVIFLAGLSLLLYPTISNAYNTWLQSKAIAEYAQQTGQLDKALFQQELKKAQDHNAALLQRENPFALPEEMEKQYEDALSFTDQGIMAYIEIPTVDVKLPIAHGTSERVLQDKIGHLEWTSLPVGGENTHCVISGHRGLPSAELFTNIDRLELGDKFYIHVLGERLEYQVCNIAVVEPEDQRLLRVEEGQDLVTLVTCTPYGINSHRLLVRGIRAGTSDSPSEDVLVKNEITAIDVVVLVSVILVAVAIVAFLVVLLGGKKKKGGRQNEEKSL